ncbi:N-acetylmuramoyl-L-alanine amidase [Rhizomicrobium electricum]|uniref:N-acetylmuramoyl-L-alanine amidase n=1 Tax=Rhizomicrobium electricum TaxID=480070 RepID=A0ABN1F8P5_9PROT|nr:N-acetylmuramoyl-L-alanine amidase [Rhizomicrobium electricum]NIJ46803.1 N-acetylmuramoyl-L-alanine amidase [Rhizomicrobium electricum]
MRLMRECVLAAMAVLLIGSAAAQSPQTVDDVIDKVLRDAPKADTRPVQQPREPMVIGVRVGQHDDRTRFVVELSEPIAMRTFTLNTPNRVVIDMPSVKWHLEGPPRTGGFGAVRSYRYGTFRKGNSRFVIDLAQPVAVGEPMVLEPVNGSGYRVVFDLFPTTQAKFDRTAGWPSDLRARDTAAQLAALPKNPPPLRSRIKRVIVIDPGHGGTDPGTHSDDGQAEKDLVLAVSLQLERVLLARGYTVHMTRDSDVAVELPERRAIAQSWHADLLISIHANSHPNEGVSGLSIYTLSEKGSDAEARAVAKKENEADKRSGAERAGDNDVASILLALSQRDTMNKSSRFAEAAIASLRSETDILPHKPHRDAAFLVLKSPEVPSVLIELGYMTNSDEARKMQTDSWRARVARAIAAAVDRQFMTAAEAGPAAVRASDE